MPQYIESTYKSIIKTLKENSKSQKAKLQKKCKCPNKKMI